MILLFIFGVFVGLYFGAMSVHQKYSAEIAHLAVQAMKSMKDGDE